ncbi:hypothetical protein HXX76_002699 [Chlamydomonas incerta]|uniref:Uracil-DNA glycosylase-like domain-containing protein n=1 Tax=Chlamydomonas incerta TaxID=51695 RepID=A0A835TBZ4_CHLIN|nr:hypothetical protein HXX76_002699 [Chlamydomonas incerta]|eukprot:KAG2442614.1 hypothetical protein HXX76_002699 [Chlamydomonas incerta]
MRAGRRSADADAAAEDISPRAKRVRGASAAGPSSSGAATAVGVGNGGSDGAGPAAGGSARGGPPAPPSPSTSSGGVELVDGSDDASGGSAPGAANSLRLAAASAGTGTGTPHSGGGAAAAAAAAAADPGGSRSTPQSRSKAGASSLSKSTKSKSKSMPSLESAPGVPEKLGDAPLRLVIVGHNPSEHAWRSGHYYSNPSNHLWPLLRRTGIAPPDRIRGPQDDGLMPAAAGVGFLDVGCGVPGTDSSQFKSEVFEGWSRAFYDRLRAHMRRAAASIGCSCGRCGAPRLVAFTGKRQFLELMNVGAGPARPRYGRQAALPPGWPLPAACEVWVCSSTSGAAAMTREAREQPYAQLAARLAQLPWPLPAQPACGAPLPAAAAGGAAVGAAAGAAAGAVAGMAAGAAAGAAGPEVGGAG